MNPNPRVSIITPSFNQASFLEETIQSVLSQDYPNLEYWIIDGGSKDGSVEIIQRYADRLAGWVSEKDSGQSEAVNKGFARATGEIIGWVNSDDYYLPGAVASAVAAFQAHPECSLIYGDVDAINGAGERTNIMTYAQWTLDDLMQFKVIGQPSVFIRRSALEQAGYLEPTYHYLLDHHLWLRVAQFGPIHYVPERWSAARYHSGAKNVSQTDKYGPEALRLAKWMETQPGLAARYKRLRRRILAGAERVGAFYLLDGNRPGPALRSYLSSLWHYPPAALPELHRVFYAAASLVVNVEPVKKWYLQRRKERLTPR